MKLLLCSFTFLATIIIPVAILFYTINNLTGTIFIGGIIISIIILGLGMSATIKVLEMQ